LRERKIAGAGLDVWGKEPPPAAHPLMKFDNVIVTAHTAGVTREARVNMGRIAAEQMLDALDGKSVTRIVNPQVWPAYAKRFERAFGFAPRRWLARDSRSRRQLFHPFGEEVGELHHLLAQLGRFATS